MPRRHLDVTQDERSRIVGALDEYRQEGFPYRFISLCSQAGAGMPAALIEMQKALAMARSDLGVGSNGPRVSIDATHAPLFREALLFVRRKLAREVLRRAANVHGSELRAKLDRELEPYDSLMSEPWLRETTPLELPRLLDYFPTRLLEGSLPDRKPAALDDKFGILYAASSFHDDLEWTRSAHELRDLSLAVAFLDIDDFKAVNTQLGEPTVDREILPEFQHCIETHVYMRGRGFKIGGDEYLLILQNVDADAAIDSMRRLQAKLVELKYPHRKPITASIGLVLVTARCPFAGQEIETKAAAAKAAAKRAAGKGALATYTDEWLTSIKTVEAKS